MRRPDPLDDAGPDPEPTPLLAELSDADYEELMADHAPTVRREPPEIRLKRCACCREWLTATSTTVGACEGCGEPVHAA